MSRPATNLPGAGRHACVFCEIFATGGAAWVAQEDNALAFLPNADPLAPGHTLVAPRTRCVGILDVPPAVLTATVDLVQRVGLAMTTGLGATGIVVLNASGPHSGQSVPHLHFHVVPCWPDDNATYWPTDRSAHAVDGPTHRILAAFLPGSVFQCNPPAST